MCWIFHLVLGNKEEKGVALAIQELVEVGDRYVDQ